MNELTYRSGIRAAAVLTLVLGGCVEAPTSEPRVHEPLEERSQEVRPTSPEHSRAYGEGVEVRSFASPAGHARVWWATEGVDRPPTADRNQSSVPDFVELVAGVADEVHDFVVEEGLFRLPIEDSTLINDPLDYGGDGRFDIYLKDFGGAGDGHVAVDACIHTSTETRTVRQCAAHIILENDFSPLYYPSLDYAVRVVVPHEYFHAVQYAYDADLPAWWSEGTATWFEEYFYPEQNDFERLTRYYFETPERSLNDRSRGPTDAFAYGASIFVYFMEQYVGVDAIVDVMERMAQGASALDGVVASIEARAGSFEDAFSTFGVFNVFTGSRAVPGRGYPEAHRFDEVSVVELDGARAVNWDVSVSPMAARFARIEVTRPIALSTRPIDGFAGARAVAVSSAEFARSGSFEVLEEQDARVFVPEDGPVFVVVTRGQASDDGGVRIALRMAQVVEPEPDDEGEEGDEVDENDEVEEEHPEVVVIDQASGGGGCAQAPGTGSVPWFGLGVLALTLIRRRYVADLR